jgi:hypothetical protein
MLLFLVFYNSLKCWNTRFLFFSVSGGFRRDFLGRQTGQVVGAGETALMLSKRAIEVAGPG